MYDFQRAYDRKTKTDDRVDDEVVRRLEKKCKEQSRERQSLINKAKKFSHKPEAYDMYMDKAEEVDMTFCQTHKDSKKTLQEARESQRENRRQGRN